jgi:hypothetical protein
VWGKISKYEPCATRHVGQGWFDRVREERLIEPAAARNFFRTGEVQSK